MKFSKHGHPLSRQQHMGAAEEGEGAINLGRRNILKLASSAGVAAAAVPMSALAVSGAQATAEEDVSATGLRRQYVFLREDEAAFVEAAVARLIPGDEDSPGAIEADVPNYIDKMLSSAWGSGERLYNQGPWHAGEPQQGYQLAYTPSQLFRTSVAALNAQLKADGKKFTDLSSAQQDDYLKHLESGKADLNGVPSDEFFDHLWQWTVEGFLSDPAYGGNRNMVSWQLLGYPGVPRAEYYSLVDKHGMDYNKAPQSFAQTSSGAVEVNPYIPPFYNSDA